MPPRRPVPRHAPTPASRRAQAAAVARRGQTPAQQRAARRYEDYQRRQESQRRGQQRQAVRRAAAVPGRGARTLQQGARGGQHALMAEFLVFCGIVAMRAIADYVPGNQGQTDEGTVKGTQAGLSLQAQQQDELHGKPAGQLGPLPVLGAGFVIFFVLSFIAARGGSAARFAAAAGLVIDAALLLKSMPELAKVSGAYAAGTGTTPAAAAATGGPAPTPAGTVNPATDPAVYTEIPVPDATGIFPVITPNAPPVAQAAGQNPDVFTKPAGA